MDRLRGQCEDQGIAEDEMRAVHIADIASSEALQGQLFDIVVAAQVMHHISDVGRVLEALAQRLKPGGTLIVIDQLRDPATPLKPPTAVVPHRGGAPTSDRSSSDRRRLYRH